MNQDTNNMENKLTNEEIARVFAMYWDVKTTKGSVLSILVYNSVFRNFDKANLLLTPLSDITDDDAAHFAKLQRYKEQVGQDIYAKVGRDIINRIVNPEKYMMSHPMCYPYDAYLFLISKSYAVPIWFGVDHWANGMDAITLNIGIKK